MTGRKLLRILAKAGCVEVRKGKGSHVLVRCGTCPDVTVPVHRGEDLATGTLAAIRKQVGPCLPPGTL